MALLCGSCKLSCRQRRKKRVSVKVPGDLREVQRLRQRHALRINACAAAQKDLFRFCGSDSVRQGGKRPQVRSGELPCAGDDKVFPSGKRYADFFIGAPPEDHRLSQGQRPETLLLSGNAPGNPSVFPDGTAPVVCGNHGDAAHRANRHSRMMSDRIMAKPIWMPKAPRMNQPFVPPSCRSRMRRISGETSSCTSLCTRRSTKR